MMGGGDNLNYETRLKVMGPTTLETRRIGADMSEVYNILNVFEGIESGSMFIKRVGISRGHSQKLFKKTVRLDVGKYCFQQQSGIVCRVR